MFLGSQGLEGPFKVQAVGEGDVDCVYGGVVQEVFFLLLVPESRETEIERGIPKSKRVEEAEGM